MSYQKSSRRCRSDSPEKSISLSYPRPDLKAYSRREVRKRHSSGGPTKASVQAAHNKAPPAVPDPHQHKASEPPVELGPPAGPREKPRPAMIDGQSQTSGRHGHDPSANESLHGLRRKTEPRSTSERLDWSRKEDAGRSPLLRAQQTLRTGVRTHPIAMDTEYRRSFQGEPLPRGPRLRKHVEHQQRLPPFYVHTRIKKKREECDRKPCPQHGVPLQQKDTNYPPHRRQRKLTEYEINFRPPLHKMAKGDGHTDHTPQVMALRQKALWYRRRAWGTHFSRDHLSQLVSEHNVLWEPTVTTEDSPCDAVSDPCPALVRGSSSPCVEALDLPSRSSVCSPASPRPPHTPTGPALKDHAGTQTESKMAWVAEKDDETDEEEGRLPTPNMKMQRTHHDITTPATGGAILVGRLKGEENCTCNQGCGADVSTAAGKAMPTAAWPDCNAYPRGPSPLQKSKAIRSRLSSPAPLQHCLKGRLRHADFQHNGDLGVRFRDLSRASLYSNEDDRMSVMSCRSAASCSEASAVLERAQRRQEDFWEKC
ncbi:nuclear protein MDM1 isoform X1 [Entelurus aequoreus]|uniref:nuclear protein MDM1 isoform X1 n=1 Tax=Entelurus aequoreus TaxID=161455 RepID=UPI002B1CFE6F|nr:nuclear protein MDM1 isoform X1 [Entelurus aequoreus]